MASLPKRLTISVFNKPAGSAMQTGLIVKNLRTKYNKIKKEIKYDLYEVGNSLVFKFKIPSESNSSRTAKVFYDVLLKFTPIKGLNSHNRLDKDYSVKVYSNCPTFTYGFTYVYYRVGCLFDDISMDNYAKLALTKAPNKTNPYKLVGIEKTLWYAFNHIEEKLSYSTKKVIDASEELTEYPGELFIDVVDQDGKKDNRAASDKTKIKKKDGRKKGIKILKDGKIVEMNVSRSAVNKHAAKLKSDMKSRNLTASLNSTLKSSKIKNVEVVKVKKNSLSKDMATSFKVKRKK